MGQDSDSTTEKVVDKATEKVCLERWHYTLLKILTAAAVVSAIAHVGEAVDEILNLFGR